MIHEDSCSLTTSELHPSHTLSQIGTYITDSVKSTICVVLVGVVVYQSFFKLSLF